MEIDMEIDLKHMCRVCLRMDQTLHPIFDLSNEDDGEQTTIAEMLTDLVKHKVRANDDLPQVVCETCMKAARAAFYFKNECEQSYQELLKMLIESHKNKKGYTCELCFKQFSSINRLKFHYKSHASEGLVCLFCAKEFNELTKLRSHLVSEHSDTGFILNNECTMCKKQFNRNKALCAHLKDLYGVETFAALANKAKAIKIPDLDMCKNEPLHEVEFEVVPIQGDNSLMNASNWNQSNELNELNSHDSQQLNATDKIDMNYLLTKISTINTQLQKVQEETKDLQTQSKNFKQETLKTQARLEKEIANLKQSINSGNFIRKRKSVMPKHPFKVLNELLDFEETIKNSEENYEILETEMSEIHVDNPRKFIRTAWRRLMTDDVAALCAWKGLSGKTVMKNMTVTAVILGAFHRRFAMPEKDFRVVTAKWFQTANCRRKYHEKSLLQSAAKAKQNNVKSEDEEDEENEEIEGEEYDEDDEETMGT